MNPTGMGVPAPGAALYGAQAQDPQSQYLAAALASMQKQPQGSATGLGENLLASALDQYGLKQRGNQLQQQAQQQQTNSQLPAALQQLGQMVQPDSFSGLPMASLGAFG